MCFDGCAFTQPYLGDETPVSGVLVGSSCVIMVYRGKAPTRPHSGEEASVTDLPYTLRHHVLLWFTGGTPPTPPDHTWMKKHLLLISPIAYVTMCYYGLQKENPHQTILG